MSSHRSWRVKAIPQGASMVEFAIVLPIFLLAIIGILEFGRAFMVNQIVVSASRAGARKAVIDGVTEEAIKTAIKAELTANAITVSDTKLFITFYVDGEEAATLGEAVRGSEVGVKVNVPFSAVALTSPFFMESTILSGECVMRRE